MFPLSANVKLDYGSLLSPSPIMLSIGDLLKPTLRQIAEMSFDKFGYFEVLIKMTPETYYTKLKGEEGENYWNSLSEEEQDNMTWFSIVAKDENLINSFVEIFNFFFKQEVIFREGFFILLNKSVDINSEDLSLDNLRKEDIRGVISEETFLQVLELIQQVCCNYSEEPNIENMKFKNETARKLMEKMLKASKAQKEEQKASSDFALPNVISAVSNMHPSINPINVWDLTIFQLMDAFERTQINTVYQIDSIRVSVWGDEKKAFKPDLWYKNNFDNN